jgi:hypothetical protein
MESDDILEYISNSTNGIDIPCSSHKIEVKESEYGLGVFATEDIEIDEIVTHYPAHIVVNKYNDEALSLIGSEINNDYALRFNDYLLYGDPNIQNKDWLGHLLNDGGDISLDKKLSYGKWFSRYILTTKILSNCRFQNDGKYMEIIAKKKINKGDQLYVSYGFNYWIKRVYNLTDGDKFLFEVAKELGLTKVNYLVNLN